MALLLSFSHLAYGDCHRKGGAPSESSANMGLHCPCCELLWTFTDIRTASDQLPTAIKCFLLPLKPLLMFYLTSNEFKVCDLLPSSNQMEFAGDGNIWGGCLVQHSNTSLYLMTRAGDETMHRENGKSAAFADVQQPARWVPVQRLHVLEAPANLAVASRNAAAVGQGASELVGTGACWIRSAEVLGQGQVPNEQEEKGT